ncbi:hypothetical protein HMI56_004262 [Coelomomyces lativittatus]|nr:hypothetical protein HMI56_004262 [Coelomomyces lativittatus]
MNVKHIVVKSKIDDLENEQGYDTLVIPSDIYQNDDSLKKFKQVYKKFWDENKIENYIRTFKSVSNMVFSLTISEILNKMHFCLEFLSTNTLNIHRDSSCTSEVYLSMSNNWVTLGESEFSGRDQSKHPLSSSIEIHRIQFSFLPWVILMEWVSTNRMRTPNPLGFGINEPSLFKSQYNCVYLNL